MPRWMWRGAKKEVPKKTVVFLRHFYAEIIPRNPPFGQVVFIAQKTTVFFGNEHDAHRGDEMNTLRKLFVVMICAVLTANTAMAASWTVGKNNECYRKGAGWYKDVKYYYCGKQTKSCAGLAQTAGMQHEFFYESEANNHFTRDGTTYWCCGGTRDKAGEFKTGDKRYTTEEKEKSVGGGTCKYTVTTDICGPVTGEECTVPTECPSGQVVRDGKCATKTSTEPKKSDDSCTGLTKGLDANGKCVKCTGTDYIFNLFLQKCEYCPETETQGVDKAQFCIDCSKNNMVWDKNRKLCVEKQDTQKITSATKQYSNDMMYECYGCSSDVQFKKCLEIYRTAPDELSNIQKSVLKACNNTYDAANAKNMVAKLKALVPDATEETKTGPKYKNLGKSIAR